MNTHTPIYLGTVLLENNRWQAGGQPSFKVSDWQRRLADEGFDGLELWANHALLADAEELERLRTGPCPVKLFNGYDTGEPDTGGQRRRITELIAFFGAEGMKFNTGKIPEQHEIYLDNLRAWRADFPADFRMLCECHRGSTMEDPEQASLALDRLGRHDFGMIIHGVNNDEDDLRARFAAYGDRITHIHANLSSTGLMSGDDLRRRIDFLGERGFRGTYTIEFTEGIRDGLTLDALYRNAVRDFRLLRSCLD